MHINLYFSTILSRFSKLKEVKLSWPKKIKILKLFYFMHNFWVLKIYLQLKFKLFKYHC